MDILLLQFLVELTTSGLQAEGISQAEARVRATALYAQCRPTKEACVEMKKKIDSIKKPAAKRLADYFHGCKYHLDYEEAQAAEEAAFPHGQFYGIKEEQLCIEVTWEINRIMRKSINK